ncbi:MAG: RDD family protein [Terriglobales bacterium]
MATDPVSGPEIPPLLPPLPAWRQEVRQRVEAYRASHPRPTAHQRASASEEREAGREAASPLSPEPNAGRVLHFRQQPALMIISAHGSAEPIADPIELTALVAKPEPEDAPIAVEPSWHPDAPGDYLQLPLPMGSSALPAAPVLPDGLASPGLRFQAGLTDAVVVAFAAILFSLAGWASQSFAAFSAPQLRPLLPAVVVVPAVLAALYLLLCAYAGGATIGMRCCGLAVTGWDGPLTAATRRRRGWASVVSLAALGLGFMWVLCDRQHLSWHDAISRTCVIVDSGHES